MISFARSLAFASLFALVACGGSSAGIPDPGGSSGGGGGGSSGSSGSGPSTSSGDPGTPPATGGPEITIRLQGSTAPFAHADGFGGETPTKQVVAIQSLYLLRTPDDASPVKVFDLGASPVEADLVSGAATTIAKVPLGSLPAGVFTTAKVGVSYVRYSVGARIHTSVAAADGRYDNEQVLSDGVTLEGQPRKKGWFRYSFAIGATTYGTLEGDNAPTPVATGAGGISMDMSGPETFYVFPVGLAIDPKSTTGRDVLFVANVFESFRWQDQPKPGYAAGVFDTTESTFEPVMAFGANSFALTVTPD